MAKDGKDMQERFQTILRESRLLARDAGKRATSWACWAYNEARRRMGWSEEGQPRVQTGKASSKGAASGQASPEGYAVGQTWQPKDRSKKARKIVEIRREGGGYYVIWQPPQGGQNNRIKEASFTRWVRREDARPE